MPKQPYGIYLSFGTPYTEEQQAFVDGVKEYLRNHGCEPRTSGDNYHDIRQPVEHAREMIAECDGALVIAFERFQILSGVENPAYPAQNRLAGGRPPKPIDGELQPTVWNQVEGALAYGQRVPMFVIVQRGVRQQGMISDKFEWKPFVTDVDAAILRQDTFQQLFARWLERVEARRKERKALATSPADLTVSELLGQLSTKHLLKLIGGVIATMGVIATLAYKLGYAAGTP